MLATPGLKAWACKAPPPGADQFTGYYRQPEARAVRASELYLYVTLGLSDGSPDSALGALLQFRL